jgi:site-specific recombinase XerD
VTVALHKKTVLENLAPRREPYWAALGRGKHLGFRKLPDGGSWIAKHRSDDGQREYRRLQRNGAGYGFEQAKADAEKWFRQQETGATNEVLTIEDACRAYAADRRQEKSEACGHDAAKRFERTIYGTAFGRRAVAKLRTQHLLEWRANLKNQHSGDKLSPAAVNRTVTAVRAALNLAVTQRRVPADVAIEWRVKPVPGGNRRRDLYLDRDQRRALVAQCQGALKDLVEAALLTGARPGELVRALRNQYDHRTKTMEFCGKTGSRRVMLSDAAAAVFDRVVKARAAKDKEFSAKAHLFARDDGRRWAHSDWDELLREAAARAELPAGTCLYTCRHAHISQAIMDGMTTLEVARRVGTSLLMIEKFYGHLSMTADRKVLNSVQML